MWSQALASLASIAGEKDELIKTLLNHLKHAEGQTPHPLAVVGLVGLTKKGQKGVSIGAVKVREV